MFGCLFRDNTISYDLSMFCMEHLKCAISVNERKDINTLSFKYRNKKLLLFHE